MSRIGFTLTGIERQLLTSLARSNANIALSTFRMATGHKINAAGDDPSAFVQLSGLQSQLGGVSAAMANVARADEMLSQTLSAMTEIQTQLGVVRAELVKDANHALTPDQRAAGQNIINAAIARITELAGTQIDGKTPLSGAADYLYSGRDFNQVAAIRVRSLAAQGQTISGTVSSAATKAELAYTGNASNQITADAVFTLSGARGATVISVAAGDSLAAAAAKVNDSSYLTGVTASVDTGTHVLTFNSVDYGAQAKAAIAVSSGAFATVGNIAGANAAAVINGQTISSSSSNVQGNRFSISQNGFDFDIEFQSGFTGAFNQIAVSGDALTFALDPNIGRRSTLSISGMYPVELGGASGTLDRLASGGSLSGLGGNTAQAIRVVDEALGDLTRAAAEVSGFHDASVESASVLMTALQSDLQDAIDVLDKTDDNEEIDLIAHYQVLADNAVSGLMILNLQRQSIVDMIRSIADLPPVAFY
ncbi:MAG: hypothetical protein IT426_20655 [Pirellulales bacterium]|nr:hypothetical protein [Pirellulales bacterium]